MRKIALLTLIIIFIGYAGWNLSESMTPYVNIAEAKAATSKVQVKGLLDKDDYAQNKSTGKYLTFMLKDEDSSELMKVKYRGTEPDRFEESYHVVAIGKYNVDDNTFYADKLLIKCPSKYENANRQ